MKINNENLVLPKGFKISGIKAGIKQSGNLDMALIYSLFPAATAATFTSNKFAAAPVLFDREKLSISNISQAIIVNSGNANACTGQEGLANAAKMTAKTAELLNINKSHVLVASTGVIGEQLPMNKILYGIEIAANKLSENNGNEAAKAIMTTDTVPKKISIEIEIDGKPVTIAIMCKGAGMIAPTMKPHATLLVFAMTDADIENSLLNKLFTEAVNKSFNRITIDGDMSTNDSAFILANGASKTAKIISEESTGSKIFSNALNYAMQTLAKETVKDGEGVTKFVTVNIKNAKNKTEAEKCAKTIANSMLCKTAWFGGDPNWGRLVMSIGMSKIDFKPENVDIFYENEPVVLNGRDADSNKDKLNKILNRNEFELTVDLKSGNANYYIWTNDLSYKYVEINAEYHT